MGIRKVNANNPLSWDPVSGFSYLILSPLSFVMGTGILKKKRYGLRMVYGFMALYALLAVFLAVASALVMASDMVSGVSDFVESIVPALVWVPVTYYYYKRRAEFH